jgi:hypothetical protein
MVKPNGKAIFLFVFMIPILTELLSGNQSLGRLFSPGNYLGLMIFYSIPALLIREAMIRWRLGVIGLFVLGIAYGFFNEGVIARTLLLTDEAMFMSLFRGYETFGINLAWAAAILPWHALHSIMYPIVIIHTLYPAEMEISWLSARVQISLGLVAMVVGSMVHFSADLYPLTPAYYFPLFWGVIAVLVGVVRKLPQKPQILWQSEYGNSLSMIKSFFIGCRLAILFVISMIMGGYHVSLAVHVLVISALLFLFFRSFVKRCYLSLPVFAMIAIGHYVMDTFLTVLFSMQNLERVLGGIVVMGFLVYLLLGVQRMSVALRERTLYAIRD